MRKGFVLLRTLATSLLLMFTLAPAASIAQASADNMAARGPRFLFASTGAIKSARPIDAERVATLQRRIAVDLDGVTIESALRTISDEAGLKLAYRGRGVALDKRVHLRASEITVAAALTSVLLDANVDIVFSPTGQAMLVPRERTEELVGTIVGRVTDATSNESIVGATVVVEGTNEGAVTGEDGSFRIAKVPAGAYTISARRIGYARMTRKVTVLDEQEVTVNFALSRVASRLDEVVTTATGDQKRLEVGNAIGSVDADSVMQSAPVINLGDMVSGRVPGVQVYNAGGYFGASSPIRIRGTNSFTVSNDPIIIIDGVRVENSAGVNPPFNASNLGTAFGSFRPGRMSDLSMFEIESIDVVKGPSATTLYGSDAANGVIVIHTKRGSAGAPRWHLWTDQGTSSPVDHFNPEYWAFGTNLSTGGQQNCLLVQVAAGLCRRDSLVTSNVLENPATTPLATGRRQVYGAQVSGGVQNFTYFLSAEKSDETGFLKMPDAEQARIEALRGVSSLPGNQVRPNYANLLNLRANIGSSLGSKAHVQLSNGLVFNTTALPGGSVYSAGAILNTPPTPEGSWYFARPGELFAQTSSEATTRSTTSLAGDYQPFTWLATRATVGLDASNSNQLALEMNGEGPAPALGERQDNRFDVKVWSADLTATGTKALSSALTSRTTVGAQYNRRKEFVLLSTGTNLAPGSQTLSGAASRVTDESTTETIVAGTFLEERLGLRERLFLTGAIRLDGGSAFGSAFKTVAYPKASLSWLATDRSQGRGPWWLDNLRLRAALGSSGVQPSAVAALQRDCLSAAYVNGVNVTGATLCQLGNANLKPERQTEYEGGVDAAFLHSRINLELTYYHRQSHDAISTVPLPPSAITGATQAPGLGIPVNLGSVRNQGIEGLLNVRVLDGTQTTLDIGLNGNVNQNRLLTLGEGVAFTPTSANQPGYPLNSRFYRSYTYEDTDGNGIISPNEVTVNALPSYLGPIHPQTQLTGTVGLGLFRDVLHLSAMADYRTGNTIVDFTAINNCFFGTCREVTDPSASLAAQAAAQAAFQGGYAGFASSGRFLALREVAATYKMPMAVASVLRARGAQLSLSGRNLGYYLTDFPGFSVESTQAIPTDALGPQNPGAPMPRYWILRLTLDY